MSVLMQILNEVTGKDTITASHYHIDTDIPSGKGNMHYVTTD